MSDFRMSMYETGKGGGQGYIPQKLAEIPREELGKPKRDRPTKKK